MRPVLPFIAWIILASVALSPASFGGDGPATAPARVALLGTSADPRVQAIRDLAEAQLAAGDQVQVLERQGIERVLAEHHLALTGLVDVDHAVNAGKILAADLLAIVESDPKSQGAAFVVFDPATGVRLWDAGLAIEEPAKAAEILGTAIRAAAAKRRNTADLHTVCLMTVRNADLPRDMDGFCDAVGRLLERNLVGSAKLALLERSRLEKVEGERALNVNGARSELFASLVIAELEVSRADENEVLRAVAILTDSNGKRLGKLTALANNHDAVALAGTLANELAAHLKAPAAGNVDRLAEASRFFAEAQLWTDASDFPRAVAPAEAAHALAPDNLLYRAKLAHALVMSGARRSFDRAGKWTQPENAPALLGRGAAMLADLFSQSFEADPASGGRSRAMLSNAAEAIRRYINGRQFEYFRSSQQAPFPPDDLAAVMGSFRRYVLLENARAVAGLTSRQAMGLRLSIHDAA